MLSRCNFDNIDVITDFGTIETVSFGNIATMQVNRNNDKITNVIFVKDMFLINIKRNTGVGGGVIYSTFLCCSSCI